MLGYVPKVEDCVIESVIWAGASRGDPGAEKPSAEAFRGTGEKPWISMGYLELAGEAPELAAPETEMLIQKDTAFGYRTEEKVRIGVADDEASAFSMRII